MSPKKSNDDAKEQESLHKNKILCVGICSLDTIATLDEFPKPDAKLRSTSLTHAGGGNAANTAVAMSRLYHNIPQLQNLQLNVDILSAVGNDGNGDAIINELESENVGTRMIERFHGNSPWSYIVIVDDTRTIIHQPATRDLSIDFVQHKLFQKHKDVQLHGVNTLVKSYISAHFDVRHPTAAVFMAKELITLGIPYSVDVERPRDGLLEILSGASIVICNANYVDLVLEKGEMESYCEEDIVKRFKMVLKEQAPSARIAVMTLGSKGSCLVSLDEAFDEQYENDSVVLKSGWEDSSPCVTQRHTALWCGTVSNCDVVDTTGAGDAFQGGFLSALWGYTLNMKTRIGMEETQICTNKNVLAYALRIATVVAARKIEKPGARAGLPHFDAFIQSDVDAMFCIQ